MKDAMVRKEQKASLMLQYTRTTKWNLFVKYIFTLARPCAKSNIRQLCPLEGYVLSRILHSYCKAFLFEDLYTSPVENYTYKKHKILCLPLSCLQGKLRLTGSPVKSEYFLAGLKDGGASIELSERMHVEFKLSC